MNAFRSNVRVPCPALPGSSLGRARLFQVLPLVTPSKVSTIIVELTGRRHPERNHARIRRLTVGQRLLVRLRVLAKLGPLADIR